MRDCPPGYACVANTENYLDAPCAAGTYQRNPRSDSCDACPEGYFCLEATAEPIACPAGTYRDSTGAEGSDALVVTNSCYVCSPGYKCPHSGMTNPYPCGTGYYSQAGAQECTICQTGFVCDGTTTTASDYESTPCDGENCELWVDTIYEKYDCTEGHYCPSGSLIEVPCPRGTYRNSDGAETPDNVSACLAAPAGKYSDREGMTLDMIADNLCAAGHKCTGGARSKFQHACNPGTYQSEEG